jgi:hypothetical protein
MQMEVMTLLFICTLWQVYELQGMDPESKPNDPAYSAVIRDQTGYATLVYRSSARGSPLTLKRGKFFQITGTQLASNLWRWICQWWIQHWARHAATLVHGPLACSSVAVQVV